MHGIKKYTAKNMKVIHIAPVKTAKVLGSNVLTAEGLSNSVFNLIEAQNRNDIDAGLLTLKKPAIDAFFNETLYNESIVSLIFPNFYLEIVKKFGEPDVVHSHDIYSVKQLLLLWTIVNSGAKVYISPRGVFSKVALSRSKYKKLLFRIIFDFLIVRKIYGFVALNIGEERSIKELYPNKRIIVAPNGVRYNYTGHCYFDRNFREKYQQSIVNIGFLGRFDVYIKGLDILLNSYVEYQARTTNIKIKLTFVGEHRNKNEFSSTDFFRKISRKLVDKSMFDVRPPSYGDAKWEEITKFDVLIQPSRTEGMPNTVLEAMSIGVPCVVSKQTNMSDIIHEAQCGWVTDLNEDSLLNIFTHLEKMDKITMIRSGINGMKYVKKNLTWDIVSKIPY
jgi:glycosyltransferase involved in cell wall biosynthesis